MMCQNILRFLCFPLFIILILPSQITATEDTKLSDLSDFYQL